MLELAADDRKRQNVRSMLKTTTNHPAHMDLDTRRWTRYIGQIISERQTEGIVQFRKL